MSSMHEVEDLGEYRSELATKMLHKEVEQFELLSNSMIIYFNDGTTFECYSDNMLTYHLYK